MANRMFNQFQGSLEKGVVQLFAEITCTGSYAFVLGRAKGVLTVSSGGSAILLKLQDTYNALLAVNVTYVSPTSPSVAPAAPVMVLNPTLTSALTGEICLVPFNNAGALTSPATGEKILVVITLSNSTAI